MKKSGSIFAKLLKRVQDKGIKTSIDVVSENSNRYKSKIAPALKYCNYAILNEIEACAVTGLNPKNKNGDINVENIKKTMEKFFEYGVKEKVIVHCTEAGFLLDANGSFTAVGSLILPPDYIKGSTGAGDAYAAACLYGLYNGYDDNTLLEFASAAAACSLSKTDSISGMKHREEILKLSKMYDRREIL